MRHTVMLVAFVVVLAVGGVPAVAPAGAAPAASTPADTAAGTTTQDCSFPVSEVDATETEVTVEAEPGRVVVLAPSTAQVLWDIGAKEKVVGMPVNQYTTYLEGADERENVVNQDGSVNQEKVVALEPDLVLAANIIENETVTQLRDAGLTVYKAGFGRSLQDIYAKTELFGRFVGACEEAEQTVSETKAEVQEIRAAVEGRERPRVLYYFFNFTVGNGTFVHEVIETAGGDNVAANAGIEGYRQVNPEIVAEQDPEWVVIPSDASFPEGEPYNSTTAYRQNQTLVVNTNLISQPGPRVVIPMRKMAEAFHPEAFRTPTPTATPTTEPPEPTPTPTPTATPTETDGGAPGFGVVPAVAALLAGALLARRRSSSGLSSVD